MNIAQMNWTMSALWKLSGKNLWFVLAIILRIPNSGVVAVG